MGNPNMPGGPSGGASGQGMSDGIDDMREEEAEDEQEQIPDDMPTPDETLEGNPEEDAQFVETESDSSPSPSDPPAETASGATDHPTQKPAGVEQTEQQKEIEQSSPSQPPAESESHTVETEDSGRSQAEEGGGSTKPYPYPINVESLPSEGRLFPHNQLNVRLINSKEEVRIKNATPRSMTKVIQDVIQNCTREDILDLTYGDRLWLYLQLRIESFHQYCYLEIECPHCEQKDPQFPVDLYDLETRSLPEDFEEPLRYRGEGVDLTLNMLRLRDVNNVNTFLKQNANKDKWDEMDLDVPELNELARTASMIKDHPDGPWRNLEEKVEWLTTAERDGGCSRKEWRILKAFENEYSHGVDFDVVQQCRKCEADISLTVPMKPQLIYPDPTDSVDLDEFRVEKANPSQ